MDYELRNIKDFLQLYNKITDMCFNACVDNLYGRDLTREEISCADNCVLKFTNVNQRLLKVYVGVQSDINQRRMAEVEAQQAKMMAEAQQQQQQQQQAALQSSGKTTYCQQIVALPRRQFDVVHVCYDSYIKIDVNYDKFRDVKGLYKVHRQKLLSYVEMIILSFKENDQTKLNEVVARWSKQFENELLISSNAMISDVVLLIDDNNYYRSMRREWQKVASKLSIGYLETFFDTALSNAIQRNRERPQPIDKQIINQMWMRLEKPNGKLYHREEDVITIQENVDYDRVVGRIEYCLEHPQEHSVVQKTVAEPMEQSEVHKTDIILRKLISKKMVEVKDGMSKQELQFFAKILQERKRRILEQIRKSELNVTEELMNSAVEELF
uniref:Zf-Tim10_DDP domain-containing protein n=1 Tax=Anopheles funestus TaxID=62324 RepID=A0A182RCL9_ANOFN